MFSVKFKVNDENRRKGGAGPGSRRSSTTSVGRNLKSPTPSTTSLNSILANGKKKKSKDDRKKIRIITSVRGDSDEGVGSQSSKRKQYRGKQKTKSETTTCAVSVIWETLTRANKCTNGARQAKEVVNNRVL